MNHAFIVSCRYLMNIARLNQLVYGYRDRCFGDLQNIGKVGNGGARDGANRLEIAELTVGCEIPSSSSTASRRFLKLASRE
jgi:hypothetical protein